ncbi:hypothetical protein B0H14DRAFT_2855496, partial [Mycena olivaceomarginata]
MYKILIPSSPWTILRISILTLVARAVALLVGRNRSEVPTAEIIGLLQKRLDLALAGNAVFAVNGLTDLVFLYRCYLVWGYRMKPILLPGILILSTTTLGIISLVESSLSKDFLLLGGGIQIITTTTVYALGLTTNVWARMALENVPDLHSSINTVYNAAISIMYVVFSSIRAEWCLLLAEYRTNLNR